ncbi:MAG: DUF3014 domain-containing protein [Rubrivivax sp.]|nr:DUF3014 domain-containing protein [Rubrivivax sp.]
MNKLTIAAVGVAMLLLAAGAYYVFQPAPTPAAQAPVPGPVVAETPAAPAAPAEPQILHPLDAASAPAGEVASAAAPAAPLPPLEQAGDFVADALTGLVGRRGVLQFLQVDGFVQHVVATVDNLPGKHATPRLWPVQPTPGRFTTRSQGDALQMDPDNAQRYLPLVQMVEAVDPAQAAALYRRLYPLFQQAYRDLGYPQGYFNDRLVQVIDHLQATPQVEGTVEMALTEVKGPYASTAPWLRYEFADPALQGLSAGQRALLRSGVVNQRRLLAWLAAFRAQIAR